MHGQPHALPLLRHFCQPSTTQTIPHLLLFGPPGTGKTTAAHAICRHLLGADWRLSCLELNASDERGIQVVRERVKGFAGVKAPGKVKIVILDEADALTADAQTALRRVIEQYAASTRYPSIANL